MDDDYFTVDSSTHHTISDDNSDLGFDIRDTYLNNLVEFKTIDRYIQNISGGGYCRSFFFSYRLDLRGRIYVSE